MALTSGYSSIVEISTYLRIKFSIALFAPFILFGQLSLAPCDSDKNVLCSELVLPMNWKDKKGGSFLLPIVIHKSSSINPLAPIFWLSGGPGHTNLDYNPPDEILKNHDVIEVGFRGVDGSIILNCPELISSLKSKNPISQKAVSDNIDAASECYKRLQSEGIDLDGFTMESVLLDLDSVRQLLNYDKIFLLSASYGTRLALYYSYLYPDNVSKSAMIGANPPGGFVWEPEMIHKKISDYSKICSNDPYCSSKTTNLTKTFRNVLNELPKRWLVFPLNKGRIQAVSFGMLYNRNTARLVIDSFLAAQNGDYSGLAAMSMSYRFLVPNLAVWGDFLNKGMIEYQDSINYLKKYNDEMYPLGSPFTQLLMDVGQVWLTNQPRKFDSLGHISTKTLIINGALDFSSPHERVVSNLLPILDSGTLIVVPDKGHVADILYDKVTKDGISNYFKSEILDFDYKQTAINFKVRNGLPTIAKITAGTLSLLTIGLIYGGYKLINRYLTKLI